MSTWEASHLYQCLGSLELHRRVVSMGLDGTIGAGCPQTNAAFGATTSNNNNSSSNSSPKGRHAHFNREHNHGQSSLRVPQPTGPGGRNSAASSNGGTPRGMTSASSGPKSPFAAGLRLSLRKSVAAAFGETLAGPPLSPADVGGDTEAAEQRFASTFSGSLSTAVQSATSVSNAFASSFTRSILWRIYLRVLPFPYTGTAREKIYEDWPATIFRCRAWYGGQRQQFLECYPKMQFVVDLDEASKRGPSLRTFSLYEEQISERLAKTTVHHGGSSGRHPASSSGGGSSGSKSPPGHHPHNGLGSRASQAGGSSPLDKGPECVRDDIICMDIRRTYVSGDPDVPHHTLFMILAMWRWQNPVIGYQQGMHEIAGNILMTLIRASEGIPVGTPVEVCECANAAFVEADAFMLFDAFMNELGLSELFAPSSAAHHGNAPRGDGMNDGPPLSSPRAGRHSPVPEGLWPSTGGASGGGGGGGGQVDSHPSRRSLGSDGSASTNAAVPLTTLEALCHHTVFELLKDHSLSLFNHFVNTNVLDQLLLFLPRWIRNIFTREMSRPQVMIVWDGILAVYYADIVAAALQEQDRLTEWQQLQAQQARKESGLLGALRRSVNFSAFRGVQGIDEDDIASLPYGSYMKGRDGCLSIGAASSHPLQSVTYVGEHSPRTNTADLRMSVSPGIVLGGSAITSSERGVGRRVGGFLRTIAGVAVELLLYLEDDLMDLPDDFSQLKRLTRTPLVSPSADASGIVLRATTIARTRPRWLVIRSGADESSIAGSAQGFMTSNGANNNNGPPVLASPRGVGAMMSSPLAPSHGRLTREDLLSQQQAVSTVLMRVASRLRTVLDTHGADITPGPQPPETSGNTNNSSSKTKAAHAGPASPQSITLNQGDISQLQGVLLELEHLSSKLR